MTLNDIRALRDAQPFQPFTLTLVDGRAFFIEAHYYLGFTPRGLVVAVSRDRTGWFSPSQVREIRENRLAAAG